MAARAAGWSEDDINRFATQDIIKYQSQQASVPQTQAQPEPPKANFLTRFVAPVIGGTLGTIGGFAAGGPFGAIAGGAAGSAGGRAFANYLFGRPAGEEVKSEAVFGALGSLGRFVKGTRALRTAKAGPVAPSAGGEGLQLAERAFTKAFQVPAKLAPRVNPKATASELLREYPGLVKGSLPQMQGVADAVTGANGAFSKLTRKAVGSIKGDIRTDEFLPEVRAILNRSALIDSNTERRILQSIFRMERPGRLPMTMNPLDAFDNIRELEGIGYKFVQASTKLSPSPLNEQIGKVYLTAADALKEGLEKAAGNQNIIQALKTPQALMDLSRIHPNLAAKFMQANTLADIRTIQRPFVNLSRMIGLTEDAAQAAGTQLISKAGAPITGAIAGGIPGAAVGLVASPFVEGITEAARAPIATKSGQLLARLTRGGGKAVAEAPKRRLPYGQLIAQTAQEAGGLQPAAGQLQGTTGTFEPFTQFGPTGATAGGAGLSGAGNNINVGGQEYPLSSFTPEIIDQMIRDDISQTGGKNLDRIARIIDIQTALTPKETKKVSPYGKPTAQQFGLANAGVQTLQRIQTMLAQDPNVITRSFTPGQGLPVIGGLVQRAAGTGEYNALANNVIDAMLRLRTGAQANKQEIELYRKRLFPQPGDSPSTVQTKLQQLYAAFEPFIGPAQGTQFDPFQEFSDALGSSGFDPFSQLNYAQ